MPVKSHITHAAESFDYPRLLKHLPTNTIVMFYSSNLGWVVANNDDVGRPWQMQKPDNYVEFHGAVTLQNAKEK